MLARFLSAFAVVAASISSSSMGVAHATTLQPPFFGGGVGDQGTADAPARLFITQNYYSSPSCSGMQLQTQTRDMGVCQAALSGNNYLLYQCVKAGTTILQLVCPGDRTCSQNYEGGSCQVNQIASGSCLFSSTAQAYVRISCSSTGIVTTSQPGGGGMSFRRALEQQQGGQQQPYFYVNGNDFAHFGAEGSFGEGDQAVFGGDDDFHV